MAERGAKLVGRTAELEGLDRALGELRAGDFHAVELVGEPGIGKTRLLEELGRRADSHGHLVLAGSASELEATLPFWVFVDALDEYVQGLDPARLEALAADDLAALAPVLPSLGSRIGGDAVPHGPYRVHVAVRRLLEALAATAPLVVLLDDVHWADAGSIELLASLLRRPPRAAVLVALAVRPGQMPERLLSTLERAHRGGGLRRVELGALSVDEARELLGTAANVVYEQSGGNPFYLQQLARARAFGGSATLDDALAGLEVPRGVAAALAEELALLPAPARRVLEGAAVAGDPFEPELAAAAADEPEGAVLVALDELLKRDLVRQTEVPRRFRFRHPLVRRAVYDAAPGGWRLAAHERLADALTVRGAPVTTRAHHVERSARHGDVGAAAILRAAAREALPRSPATAARLFAAALRLVQPEASDRPDVLAELAGAHAAAGQFQDAYAATLEMIAGTATPTPPDLAARCAGLENLLGHHQTAHTRLTTALADLSDATSAEAVSLMLQLAADAFYRMDYEAMRGWAERASAAARPRSDRSVVASTLGMRALAGVFAGTVAEAEASRAEGASLVDTMADEELAGCLDDALDTLGAAEVYLGYLREGGAHVERALAIARATGQDHVVPVLFWVGTIRTARGQIRGAVEVLDTAVEVARVSGHAEGAAWNLFARSLAATAAGDIDTALAAAEESDGTLRALDRSFPSIGAGVALAAARLEAGDPAGAADALTACAGDADFTDLPAVWRPAAFELLTRCELTRGRGDAAAEAAGRCRAAAVALGVPMPLALADRAAAAVALERGDAARAAAQASASASAVHALGAPLDAAAGWLLAGRALARAGERGAAVAELQRAADTFESCGATGRRDAVERELGRLGRRRPRRTRRGAAADGIGSLTERELEVVQLVVDRRTNPEIAAALFLSPKTVETHIRHVFHKLGVSSRVEVARVVERARRAAP